MSNIANRLREHRHQCNLTLTQVSEITGLSVSFLSDIEKGRANPSLTNLEKLCECYHTTIAELYMEGDAQEYIRQVRIRMLEQAQREIGAELARLRGGNT